MTDVKDMVKQAVDRVNADALEQTEQRVKILVGAILADEAEILRLHDKVMKNKKELKELQIPNAVSVDI